jgi:WD40 repeat protein
VQDLATGEKTFKFYNSTSAPCEVTAMTFDTSCRRLITGSQGTFVRSLSLFPLLITIGLYGQSILLDGTIKIWNFHTGLCMHEMKKADHFEVGSLRYVDLKESKFVVASAWNGVISIFPDDEDHYTVHPYRVYTKQDPIGSHRDDL